MIDAYPPKYKNMNAAFNEIIDSAVKARREEEAPRTYLGGSRLGVECERALAYEWHNTPKDEGRDFSGRLYRIFDRGHDGEERMIEYLNRAGFALKTQNDNGGQFGFAVALDRETGEHRIKGHADGIIIDGPTRIGSETLSDKYPMLWENKVINDKSFNDLAKKGLAKSKPIYFTQCQVYMAYLELKYALFTAVNANTMEIYAEIVPLDIAHAQEASDKGVRIIKTETPEDAAKISSSSTAFVCKWCDYHERCWNVSDDLKASNQDKASIISDWVTSQWGKTD